MTRPTYIIDFDSTMVTVESLEELASLALAGRTDRESVLNQVELICNQGMSGEIGFDESLNRRLKLFQANRQHVDELIEQLLGSISPSALANLEWFRRNRADIYVLSGAFIDWVAPITKRLGLRDDHVFANRLIYNEKDDIVGYDRNCLLSQPLGKAKQAAALSLPQPVIVIGDGYTDYEIRTYGAAQAFWAFAETVQRPELFALADRVLFSFDGVQDVQLSPNAR